MKRALLVAATAVFLVLVCTWASRDDSRPGKPKSWEVGYWVWNYEWPKAATFKDNSPLDVVYVQAGGLRERFVKPWSDELPAARRYVIVFRLEGRALPNPNPQGMVESYSRLKRQASKNNLVVSGLQIDFDCPTESLAGYGDWLTKLREVLPDEEISVTALLDWFRPGTGVEKMLRAVDEFVPQFYDVGEDQPAISLDIDPERWAPIFNRCGRPYRIGISTFGRIYKKGKFTGMLRDLSLLQVSSTRELKVDRRKTQAGELLLEYQAEAGTRVGYHYLDKDESIQVILPTPESVGRNYQSAKRFGEYCAGVLFFRWPLEDETTVFDPAEIQQAIAQGKASGTDGLEAEDGGCATLNCSDLYLVLGNRYQEQPRTVIVLSSADVDYFLADPKVKTEDTNQRRLTFTIPAFPGQRRIYLGRAFSEETNTYRLEGEK